MRRAKKDQHLVLWSRVHMDCSTKGECSAHCGRAEHQVEINTYVIRLRGGEAKERSVL